MIATIITALTALAKAIPALAGLCEKLVQWAQAMDSKRNEAQAIEREHEKNARNDAAIAAANRLPPDGPGDTRKD